MFLFRPWSRVKRRTRIQLILAACGTILLSVCVPLLAWHSDNISSLMLDPDNAQRNYNPVTDLIDFNGIAVFATIINLDLVSFNYKLRLSVIPCGRLMGSTSGDLYRPSTIITVVFDTQVIVFPTNLYIRKQDAMLNIDSGNINRYPFDTYNISYVVSASFVNSTTGVQTPIPIYLATMASTNSWQADASFNSDVSPTLKVLATFYRSWTSRFFSLLVFTIMWILSITAFILAATLWFRNRKVEPPTIAVIASLLFSLPAIRSSQPGSPPVGCTLDIAGYFWNIGLAALSMFLLMLNYVVRYKREKRHHYNPVMGIPGAILGGDGSELGSSLVGINSHNISTSINGTTLNYRNTASIDDDRCSAYTHSDVDSVDLTNRRHSGTFLHVPSPHHSNPIVVIT
ncbi:hypothetical protein BDV3_002954 [Batrachochytrium dendrobatidis]